MPTMIRASFVRVTKALGVIAATALLISCGGGGGGGSSSPPVVTPPPSSGTGWVAGVFRAASTFKDRCAVVRTGLDIEGNAFPDISGTLTDEKNWLRSWTNETYLWNTEVADTNPATGGTRTAYFANLKTFATTSSGKLKDDFHFSEPTADYLRRRNSAASASYGAEFAVLSATVPRDVRVVYTEPGSPADTVDSGQKKLIRGSRILRVNGIDLVSGGTTQAEIDILNDGLFPSTVGVTTTFVVQDPGAVTTRTISLTAQNLTSKPVNRTRVITDAPTGQKVGYILFNTFSPFASEREIVDAMQLMRNESVQDLVLDLRYNGGGLLAVASQLSYMVAGDTRTNGRTFERLRFNSAAGTRNPVTGSTNNPVPFYKTGLGFTVTEGTALPTLNLARVFVLATDSTCSASEAVLNGLRGIGVEVIVIGGKTCGKPFGFYPQDNCGETYYTIQFQGVNDIGFGDYADGFVPANTSEPFGIKLPGCVAADDLNHELGDDSEGLLRTALNYRNTTTCPVTFTASAAVRAAPGTSGSSLAPSLAIDQPERSIMTINRDMALPVRR